MDIPSFTLSRQIEKLGPELENRIHEVLQSGHFILGDSVKEFEREMGQMLGVSYTVGVASGSDALYLALRALGIGPGHEVVTTPFTFFATAGSILRTGAKPVFSDIDLDTFNMDSVQALSQVTPRTRAMLPVHLFGLMADLGPLAEGFSGPVVEDAAQAILADRAGKRAGTAGTLGCFSFFPTKNLGAMGDAGMVTTNDQALAEKLRMLRVHGARRKYFHEVLGLNSRIDALQAVLLTAKLKYLEEWTHKRQMLAAHYSARLRDLGVEEVVTPVIPPDSTHVFHQYTIRADRRDQLMAALKSRGIGSTVYYPVPLHLQPVFSELGYRPGDFPVSERASSEVLSLPMFPELTIHEVDVVVEAIAQFYGHGGIR